MKPDEHRITNAFTSSVLKAITPFKSLFKPESVKEKNEKQFKKFTP